RLAPEDQGSYCKKDQGLRDGQDTGQASTDRLVICKCEHHADTKEREGEGDQYNAEEANEGKPAPMQMGTGFRRQVIFHRDGYRRGLQVHPSTPCAPVQSTVQILKRKARRGSSKEKYSLLLLSYYHALVS